MPAGGTPTGEMSGSGPNPQASSTMGTPAGVRSISAVVPTADGEVKVDSKLQPTSGVATVRSLSALDPNLPAMFIASSTQPC